LICLLTWFSGKIYTFQPIWFSFFITNHNIITKIFREIHWKWRYNAYIFVIYILENFKNEILYFEFNNLIFFIISKIKIKRIKQIQRGYYCLYGVKTYGSVKNHFNTQNHLAFCNSISAFAVVFAIFFSFAKTLLSNSKIADFESKSKKTKLRGKHASSAHVCSKTRATCC